MKSKSSSVSTRTNLRPQELIALPICDMLTPAEIEALRQDAIEGNAFVRKELARLFLEPGLLEKKFGTVLSKEELAEIRRDAREKRGYFQEESFR